MLFPVVLSRIECTMNYLILTGLEVWISFKFTFGQRLIVRKGNAADIFNSPLIGWLGID